MVLMSKESSSVLASVGLIKFSIRGRSQTTLIRFWLFLTTYPPLLTFSMISTLAKSGHFWTTYLSSLVKVVCERPPSLHSRRYLPSISRSLRPKSMANHIDGLPRTAMKAMKNTGHFKGPIIVAAFLAAMLGLVV